MASKELRQKLVKTAKSYMGAKRGSKEHRFLMANDIMGIFNKAGI